MLVIFLFVFFFSLIIALGMLGVSLMIDDWPESRSAAIPQPQPGGSTPPPAGAVSGQKGAAPNKTGDVSRTA